MHVSSFNHKYRAVGANRVPIAAGDRYWSQDLARDHRYLQGLAGRALLDLFGTDSVLLSGGVVTEGSTKAKVNVAAAIGICSFDVEVPDDSAAWAVPAPYKTDQVKVRASCPAVVDLALGGTLDGATVNYVKLRFLEADGSNSRNREYASGSYACSKAESYQLVADAVAPTAYDVLLATYVGNGTSTLSITQRRIGAGRKDLPVGTILMFDANGAGATVAATALVPGNSYKIATVGTTDFTLVGAASNTVGVEFIATRAGTGTGTALCGYSGAWEDNITIPGWFACIASNSVVGCPNLTDKFVCGKAIAGAGATGGTNSYQISSAQLPTHTHTIDHGHTASSSGRSAYHQHGDSGHTHPVGLYSSGGSTNFGVSSVTYNSTQNTGTGYAAIGNDNTDHSHTITVNSMSGSSGNGGFANSSVDNRPAYYSAVMIRRCF